MLLEDLQKEMMKLAPSSYSKDTFIEHLHKCFQNYVDLLKGLDKEVSPKNHGEVIKKVEDVSSKLLDVVKLYYEGRHSASYRTLSNVMDKVPRLSVAGIGFDFYRMRVYHSKEKPTFEGLFHIPFDKRGIVKTERFSTPGYPCLYLGRSIYACWEEMNRPNMDSCFVSRFHLNEIMYMVNLALPFTRSLLDSEEYRRQYLIRFPLVIASMVKVKNAEDTFKPEYIIPQLITEWVIECQYNDNIKPSLKPIGIFYSSVHYNKDFNFPDAVFTNVAFPAFSPFEGKYSKNLCTMFTLTDPTCDEYERAKMPYSIFLANPQNKEQEESYNYQISSFGQLEKRLKDEKRFPLKKITE